jgi:hypothetical protein
MTERFDALVALAEQHQPCSVRHLFYRAVVNNVVGITKNECGYAKVQRAALLLRRNGRIPYEWIVDNTRWMRKPTTWSSFEDALRNTARTYRRDLWIDTNYRVEVWCESDSTAGVIYDVVDRWDVPLMVTRGFTGEAFAYNSVDAWLADDRQPVVLYVGDHDPAGLEIECKLREALTRFYGLEVPFHRVAVTWDQVVEHDLPGTLPKKTYGYDRAVEAEALAPELLRELVDATIVEHVNQDFIAAVLAAERSERELLTAIANRDFVELGT